MRCEKCGRMIQFICPDCNAKMLWAVLTTMSNLERELARGQARKEKGNVQQTLPVLPSLHERGSCGR